MYDQLFSFNNTIYMVEQKIRDDHDSTKKRGQFSNFLKKVEYLKSIYSDKKIISIMWFVDPSLIKNKKYYTIEMQNNSFKTDIDMHLFYGKDFFSFLSKEVVWDELLEYLNRWKESENNEVLLNFEENWKETKRELMEKISLTKWKKIFNNERVMKNIMPILFPSNRHLEIKMEIFEK